MGVDITTYRCRVGSFVSCRGAGMPFCMSFSQLVKLIGSLAFIRILLVMAGVETNPGPTEKFIFRYQYLLVKIGTILMRRLFEVKVGQDFANYLASNTTEAQTLKDLIKAKKITPDQAQYLPPVDMKPDSSNFDITLLTCLLRNVCGLKHPKDTVWMNPSPTDTSEEADIARLRLCRNWLMHRDTLVLPDTEFDDKWKELSGILNRLNTICGITGLSALIDTASKMDTDEELNGRLDQTLKAWDALDQDVISKLDRMAKRSADGHDRVVKKIKTIKPVVAKVQKEMKQGFSTVQQELKQGLTTMQQEVTIVHQGLTTVHLEVKNGLSTMQQEVKQGLTTMQQEVKTVQQGLTIVLQDVPSIKQELSTVQQEVQHGLTIVQQDVQQEVSTIQQGLSTVQQDVKQGLTTVQQDVKQGLSTVQQEVKQGLTTVHQEVTTVQQGLTAVLQVVPSIKQGLSTVQQEVQQGLSIVQQKVSTIQQGFTTVQQEVQRGLTTMQQDMIKLKSCPSEEAKVIQEKLITIYQRDCRLLQVSPVIEDDNEDLMSIYQSPTLHRTVYDRDHTKVNQETISSYEEIFCKDDKTFTRVYITGDAGVGKTSLCRRMCLLWSKSRSGDYAGNDESTKRDIKFLEKFDFLFHVSLGATDRRDMIMMIVDQLFYSECDDERTDMYKLIKRILNQHDSLIVLDGYDEWNPKTSGKHDCKTPKGIESEKCVFLTTCRPYKLENVRLSGNDIDHQIEMSGIHGRSSVLYVTEVVKYMNEKYHCQKDAFQFRKEVELCKLNDQLCIPMICSHLIVVWWSNQKLTHFSKAFLYGKILEMLFKRAERKVEFLPIPPSDLKLPKCFSELDYVNEHVFLLKKVCLLSFNSLFKLDECASTLVFTKKQLMSQPYLFTTDEMDFLCKLGIISKNKVIGVFEDQKQILSFLHQSYIEFFSALYFSSYDACYLIDSVVKTFNLLNDVLQYKNFFQFLAGLSGQKLNVIFEKTYSLLKDHLNLLRKKYALGYLHKNDMPMEQLRFFQTIVKNCFIEVKRSADSQIVLRLEDFIFDGYLDDDILKQLLLLNKTSVRSIQSVGGKYYDEFDQIKNLHCLHVGNLRSVWLADNVYDVKSTECMLQNQSTHHTVCNEDRNHTLLPELPVRSLQHLTSLSLSRVQMSHNSLHNLVTCLSDNVLIENIKLSRVYCDNHRKYNSACTCTLNLPHHAKLTSLYLSQINILCNHVNSSSLKSITLCPLSKESVSVYIDVFNCIKYSHLEHLYMDGSYWLDFNATKTLVLTVNTLPYIKSLTLWRMQLPDDVLLQLHPDLEIELKHVTMSRQCFDCFFERFPQKKEEILNQHPTCEVKGRQYVVIKIIVLPLATQYSEKNIHETQAV